MKKILLLAVLAVIAACHFVRDDTHDSHYFHTGTFEDGRQR